MQQFIGRKIWLQRFQEYCQQDEGQLWRITGLPGIGKSTLLRQFGHVCEQAQSPYVRLDMDNFTPAQGLDVLTVLAQSARFFNTETVNKSLKEKVGEKFKSATDFATGALELTQDFIPLGSSVAGTFKLLVKLTEGAADNAAQISEKEVAAHPELYLLNALAAVAKRGKKPVCLVDTYEHALRRDLKLKSRLMLGDGSARDGQEQDMLLAEWLAKLFDYLKAQGWRIVMAGRAIPRSEAQDSLPRFTRAEMRVAAQHRPAFSGYLLKPEEEEALLTVLTTLSFGGNPLWLQLAMNLLENLLAQGEDLNQLVRQPDQLQAFFEEEDPFDLGAYEGVEHGRSKLALLTTLTRPIDGLEVQAWKIALPRVLDKGIVSQLFEPEQTHAVLHSFTLAGLFRTSG